MPRIWRSVWAANCSAATLRFLESCRVAIKRFSAQALVLCIWAPHEPTFQHPSLCASYPSLCLCNKTFCFTCKKTLEQRPQKWKFSSAKRRANFVPLFVMWLKIQWQWPKISSFLWAGWVAFLAAQITSHHSQSLQILTWPTCLSKFWSFSRSGTTSFALWISGTIKSMSHSPHSSHNCAWWSAWIW